jgi:hypothetical protein
VGDEADGIKNVKLKKRSRKAPCARKRLRLTRRGVVKTRNRPRRDYYRMPDWGVMVPVKEWALMHAAFMGKIEHGREQIRMGKLA